MLRLYVYLFVRCLLDNVGEQFSGAGQTGQRVERTALLAALCRAAQGAEQEDR